MKESVGLWVCWFERQDDVMEILLYRVATGRVKGLKNKNNKKFEKHVFVKVIFLMSFSLSEATL